ncbi:hypothetical protein [Methylobacterium sp. NEAU K]|uniref:hypothetical protein n=1 Tax=Methylobacterium sp. NEAU K TaxID=3064946 RepID=UPI002735C067|nr:hypothetical protein [Methylobacterium sp. NEAU K]MDP4006944.1 hypothetical protein [Methylobacterium sp. NEAU K]
MTENLIDDVGTRYIRQIQQQKIELTILKSQLADALRDRDASRDQARAQSGAMAILLDSLLASLRPYGFSRKKFLAAVRKAALAVPSHGPDALQHAVLFDVSNKILRRPATRSHASIAARLS